MNDQTEKPKLGTRAPLGIKRTVETGKVKQSFSHGRSNTVVVEVKKRRILGKPGEAPEAPKTPEPEAAPQPEAKKPEPKPSAPAPKAKPSAADDFTSRKEMQTRLLREAEEARLASLEEARRREDRAKVEQTEEERRRAEENRKAEETAAEEARLRAEEEARAASEPAPEPEAVPPQAPEQDEDRPRRHGHAPAAKRPEPARPSRGREEQRHRGKLTGSRALSD